VKIADEGRRVSADGGGDSGGAGKG
jgi:hypothetical protein